MQTGTVIFDFKKPYSTNGPIMVVTACSHPKDQVTIGPTTDQRNHYCPECGSVRTTWPDRTTGGGNA